MHFNYDRLFFKSIFMNVIVIIFENVFYLKIY
jgi:hypothetical protein